VFFSLSLPRNAFMLQMKFHSQRPRAVRENQRERQFHQPPCSDLNNALILIFRQNMTGSGDGLLIFAFGAVFGAGAMWISASLKSKPKEMCGDVEGPASNGSAHCPHDLPNLVNDRDPSQQQDPSRRAASTAATGLVDFDEDEILSEQLTRNVQFFGLEGQKRIANSFVVVIGLGVGNLLEAIPFAGLVLPHPCNAFSWRIAASDQHTNAQMMFNAGSRKSCRPLVITQRCGAFAFGRL
jgi:hypothetical protein